VIEIFFAFLIASGAWLGCMYWQSFRPSPFEDLFLKQAWVREQALRHATMCKVALSHWQRDVNDFEKIEIAKREAERIEGLLMAANCGLIRRVDGKAMTDPDAFEIPERYQVPGA
jgi:hypothetical protein